VSENGTGDGSAAAPDPEAAGDGPGSSPASSGPPADASAGSAARDRGDSLTGPTGAPLGEPHTDLELPRRFGPYVLLRLLATGGMAELFLAQQRSVAGFEKLLVVKRILPHLARDSVFIEMLLSEARIAATLNHPNIAHVYDVGVHDGNYYIAMELIRGEDLRSIVRQMRKKDVAAFPLEHAVAVGIGCLAGLAYAHETTDLDGQPLELVHRDVSPQNVVVSFSGDVKLVDFGIAKAGRSRMEDTHAGRLKGKIPYMSPEQASGREIDSRSDLFSLGIVLYELSTGRRLFKGPSELESLKMITEGGIPPARSLNPRVPEPLEGILMKLLARDPDDRYQRARDAQADLEAFVRETRMPVSPLSFGAFVSELFEEEIVQQEAMLQEARQVALATTEPPPAVGGGTTSVAPGEPAGSDRGAASPGASTPAPVAAPGPVAAGPSSAPPAPAPAPGVPFGRVVALVVAVALAAGLLAWLLRPSGGTPKDAAPTPAPSAAPDPAPTAPVPTTASIRVSTEPPGAAVHLDGGDTGETTPVVLEGLTADARHEIRVERDGYAAESVAPTLSPGTTTELALTLSLDPPLRRGEALLRLRVSPDDAQAVFGGQPLDGGAVRERRTRASRGRLVVRKPGFVTQERRVELTEGEITDLRVHLRADRAPPEGAVDPSGGETRSRTRRGARRDEASPETGDARGRLVFDARPWCEVTIDGRRLGQTPIVAEALPVGRHRLVCRNPERSLRKETTVEIRAGQTTRVRLDLE